MRSRILFMVACDPWEAGAAAALDVLLTSAVMDQDVHLYFEDAGVLHLVPDQDGTPLQLKTLANQLPALELYGAISLYAHEGACRRFGVDCDHAPLPVKLLDDKAVAQLVASCDIVERYR